MLRGTGGTRFLFPATARTGNAGILAIDAIELMDALRVDRFVVAGHDWGSSVAEMLAVGWPERVSRTRVGTEVVTRHRRAFARYMWDHWSPPGWYDETTLEQVAKSWRNPDWVKITLHSYRSRWGEAPLDRRSRRLESKVRHFSRGERLRDPAS
jgi:pimeloyl-ACP methyl ester carboxylesterase